MTTFDENGYLATVCPTCPGHFRRILMTEKPILFSGEMVRAILDGRKTQTRRVVRRRIADSFEHPVGQLVWHDPIKKWSDSKNGSLYDCPYGRPGDFLWVRETWKPGAWRDNGRIAIDYKASPELTNTPWLTIPEDYTGKQFDELWPQWTDELLAAGSVPDRHGIHHWAPGKSPLRWRPSIFMPRWASRITLQVTAVRVERVQDISEADAKAEGADPECKYTGQCNSARCESSHYRRGFQTLWDFINEKRGYGWDTNPWCWCISFDVMHQREVTE